MQYGVPDVRCLQTMYSIVVDLRVSGMNLPRELKLTYHTRAQTDRRRRLPGSS